MKNKLFSFRQRLASFQYAINGFKWLIANEHNARIHSVLALLVICFAWFLNVSRIEWLFLILIIALVFVTEIFNTCIENICDLISSEQLLSIKIIKDLAAAAVLITAIAAIAIAAFIFIPKILILF